jgi:hypothetical protein
LHAAGWTPSRLAGAYSVEANRKAPWARLDAGVRRPFLEAQYGRNQSFRELVPADLIRTPSANQALVRRWSEAWKVRRASEKKLVFSVTLTERAVAAGRDQAGAALARAFMLEDPLLAREFRGFAGSWWGDTSGDYCALAGDDRLSLTFLPLAADFLAAWALDDPRWLSVAERFEPFGSLTAGLVDPGTVPGPWTVEARAPWPLDGQKLLTSRGLKHTLRRLGPGHWSFDFPLASLKKDWIVSMDSFEVREGWLHRLIPGSKWEWRVFLEEGFDYPPEGGASLVRLTALEGSPLPH